MDDQAKRSQPAKRLVRRNPPIASEESVQQTIVQGLRLLGLTVLQTTVRSVKTHCHRCGSKVSAYGSYGADKGVPDLLVTSSSWPMGFWLGLEVKSASGTLRPEQKALHDEGHIFVVRSWEEAKAAVDLAVAGMVLSCPTE